MQRSSIFIKLVLVVSIFSLLLECACTQRKEQLISDRTGGLPGGGPIPSSSKTYLPGLGNQDHTTSDLPGMDRVGATQNGESLPARKKGDSQADYLFQLMLAYEPLAEPFRERICPMVAQSSVDAGVAYIVGLYLNVLGRYPTREETRYWLSTLGNVYDRSQREKVALGILLSEENQRNLIAGFYQGLLGREVTAYENAVWLSVFQREGVSVERLLTHIRVSFEYSDHQDLSGFIHALYRDLLNRKPDEAGLAHWMRVGEGEKGFRGVVSGIMQSEEYRRAWITYFYQAHLGRDPEPYGMSYWLAQMASGLDILHTEAKILSSEEYLNRQVRHHAEYLRKLCL